MIARRNHDPCAARLDAMTQDRRSVWNTTLRLNDKAAAMTTSKEMLLICVFELTPPICRSPVKNERIFSLWS